MRHIWTKAELEALAEAVESGVIQLEMAAALPQRLFGSDS